MEVKKKKTNPFVPSGEAEEGRTFIHDDIVEYEIVQVVKKTGEGDTDYILVDRIEEVSRVDRQEYLQSNYDKVGIQNILKQVNATGDIALLNQTGRVAGAVVETINGKNFEAVADVTQLPESITGAYNAIALGIKAYETLSDEIKSKISLNDFITLGDSALAEALGVKQTLEGEKKDEQ